MAHLHPFLLWLCLSLISLLPGVASGSITSQVCDELVRALPGKVFTPTLQNYDQSLLTYYTQQESLLKPSCIVQPFSAQDAASAIKILFPVCSNGTAKFAVRSGGHGINTGSANIDGGVTFDLSLLDSIDVRKETNSTSIGVGTRWAQVYKTLNGEGLGIQGGRDERVGVGGLVLGGGVSFMSPRRGFVADDVVGFQVVLANGSIVEANANSNHDLFTALKGGGNNFGIVTRIDITHFSSAQEFWGGQIDYPEQAAPQVLDAFSQFVERNSRNSYDEFASLVVSFTYANSSSFATVTPVYTKPIASPTVYENLTTIQPQLQNTMRVASITDFTHEVAAVPGGLRNLFMTTTFRPTAEYHTFIHSTWNKTLASLSPVKGLIWPISFQPLPLAITGKSLIGNRQGNSLGLDAEDEDLVLLLLSPAWVDAADDEIVQKTAREFLSTIEKEATRLSLSRDFRYVNYASAEQDVIKGYGPFARDKLMATSVRYDPNRVFQKAVPGGFKLH